MPESLFQMLMRTRGRPALDRSFNLYPLALVIQRLKDLPSDAAGDGPNPHDDDNWETFATANAKISSDSSTELSMPQVQRQGARTATFEMLYVEGVTSEMRVLFEGRKFNISAAPYSPGERKVYTVLQCIEMEPTHG